MKKHTLCHTSIFSCARLAQLPDAAAFHSRWMYHASRLHCSGITTLGHHAIWMMQHCTCEGHRWKCWAHTTRFIWWVYHNNAPIAHNSCESQVAESCRFSLYSLLCFLTALVTSHPYTSMANILSSLHYTKRLVSTPSSPHRTSICFSSTAIWGLIASAWEILCSWQMFRR